MTGTPSEARPAALPLWRRGDVVLASVPFVSDPRQEKTRPVVIVQNDVGNRFSANVIVAGITSQVPRREYPTNVILVDGSPEALAAGIDRSSANQAEVLLTLPKTRLVRRIGQLPDSAMRRLDQCLRVSLGLS